MANLDAPQGGGGMNHASEPRPKQGALRGGGHGDEGKRESGERRREKEGRE